MKLLFENWRSYTKTLSEGSLSIGMGGQYPPEEDPSKEEATEDSILDAYLATRNKFFTLY